MIADHVPGPIALGQGVDRLIEEFDMIVGVVRSGVAGTQHRREWFVRLVAPHTERVEPRTRAYT